MSRKATRKRDVPLHVMLSPEERQRFDKLAKQDGLTLRALVVKMLDAYRPGSVEARLRALEEALCMDQKPRST